MKNFSWFIVLVIIASFELHAQSSEGNPFARLGYKADVYTFGEKKEFHDQAEVVEIGDVLFNTKTNEVVGFVEDKEDSLIVLKPELQSMSIDPHCEKYYSISPYAYCFNNPVRYIDPDGKDGLDVFIGTIHSIGTNLSLGTYNTSTDGVVADASDYNLGRDIGDVISVGIGIVEGFVGGTVAGGGTAVTVGTAGVAAPVGLSAAAAGVGMVAHGVATATTATANLMTKNGRISQDQATRGKGNTSSGEKNSPHANQKAKEVSGTKYENAKLRYDELKSKPNKTSEDRKLLNSYKKEVKHLKEKKDFGGENHSRNAKGNR